MSEAAKTERVCEPDEKCGIKLWHLVRKDWPALSVLGTVVLLALLALAEQRFVKQVEYEKDQTALTEQLREIRGDVKELLKRR